MCVREREVESERECERECEREKVRAQERETQSDRVKQVFPLSMMADTYRVAT